MATAPISTVEALRRKERSLQDQLSAVRESLQKAMEAQSGLRIGQVITDKNRKELRITEMHFWNDAEIFYLKVNHKKKNGEWSDQDRTYWPEERKRDVALARSVGGDSTVGEK